MSIRSLSVAALVACALVTGCSSGDEQSTGDPVQVTVAPDPIAPRLLPGQTPEQCRDDLIRQWRACRREVAPLCGINPKCNGFYCPYPTDVIRVDCGL